ncbi:hypothetical protein [Candidatus Tokpelaia sp.]|uniref:hypothetical protein n=1 Tax=Candidatus Tokpelaia sp. TaxID=2233777 RepID=UPI0012392815|nr:hypothetical protein [Candidatus Tokpelaia sp.]KAA6405732.1 hypothetical protein DPQ22_03525 [Candidatus Tokpelaia sp.]
MSIVEKIAALRHDDRLEKVRKQAEELGQLVEKQSGVKFSPRAEYEGYDISRKFMPVERLNSFRTCLK